MTDNDLPVEDELTVLKARADQLGIKYHPSIGVDSLRKKVTDELSTPDPAADEPPAPKLSAKETAAAQRRKKMKDAAKLVRCRITSMDPKKAEWEGELFTVSNAVVGTMRKYVPYGVDWHVPQIIFNQIKNAKCQVFSTYRDSRGNRSRKGKLVDAYGIEVLPNLSEKELNKLAQRQAMAAGTADE